MQHVLSTKLEQNEFDRFTAIAKQQGESKCSLLKRIVQDHLDSSCKANRLASSGVYNPENSINKGLSIQSEGLNNEYPPSVPYQLQNNTLKSNSVVDSSLSIHEHKDHTFNPAFLSTGGQPIYNNARLGRSATSPKQSSGISNLICVGLLGLCLWLGSATTADCAAEPFRRKPILGVYH